MQNPATATFHRRRRARISIKTATAVRNRDFAIIKPLIPIALYKIKATAWNNQFSSIYLKFGLVNENIS